MSATAALSAGIVGDLADGGSDRYLALTTVLDAQTAPYIDVTATDMLTQLAHDLHRQHATLAVAHPIGQTRDVLRQAAESAGATIAVYPDVDAAVAAAATAHRSGEP